MITRLSIIVFSIFISGCSNKPAVIEAEPNKRKFLSQPEAKNRHRKITNNSNYFGKFSGKIRTEWLDENGRTMKLLSDLKFQDSKGKLWLAPKDSVVDGASIPEALWSVIGSPFSGRYRNASVVHDVACQKKRESWESVHLMFYDGMMSSGVSPLKAKIMYSAVRHLGPRWSKKKRVIQAGFIEKYETIPAKKSNITEKNIEKLISKIKNSEVSGNPMTLEEINNFEP